MLKLIRLKVSMVECDKCGNNAQYYCLLNNDTRFVCQKCLKKFIFD